jgi:hypothetical protein
MVVTDTAAAYGLFQLVFADVTKYLAIATFRLRQRHEPQLTFEDVFRQRVSETRKQLWRELSRFDDRPTVSAELTEMREACEAISKIESWRNSRVHALVEWTDEGYALYDWHTHRRLEVTLEQIEEQIELANRAGMSLRIHTPAFESQLNWDEELDKLLSPLMAKQDPSPSESAAEAEEQKQAKFFTLAERLRDATDPDEVKVLGDKLGRLMFGG